MSFLIQKIEPADQEGNLVGSAINNIPAPSSYRWGKKDLSAPDAGRTTALKMLKMLKGKVRTLDLIWAGKSYAEMASIFQSFDYEYAWMTYIDGLTGGVQRKHFYFGDMSSDSYTATDGGKWESGTINCVQATPDLI